MSNVETAPVGLWAGTVSHDGQVEEYTIDFSDNGSLAFTTHKSKGAGTWSATGQGTFRYTVREDFNRDAGQRSPTGKVAAYIEIEIDARRTGSTYAGTGTAEVHGPDGEVIYSTVAETTAQLTTASA